MTTLRWPCRGWVGGVDEDVGVLRDLDRVEKVVCAGVFFAVAEDDEDSAAPVDEG
jgi:hypothetical protein